MIVNESRIDFPVSDGLSEDVWNKDENGKFSLKPYVRKKIFDEVAIIERKLRIKVTNVRIIGSICTNLFGDTTDIDVHLSVTKKFANDDIAYQFNKRLWNIYEEEGDVMVKKHPMQFFVQHNFFRDMASVGVYSVTHDRWMHGPTLYPKTYNPFDELKSSLPTVNKLSRDYSEMVSALEVAIRNYVTCCQAEANGYAQKNTLRASKERFASDIKKACKALIEFADGIKKNRRSASAEVHSFKDAKKFRNSKSWHRADAIAKFIDRYGYLSKCSDIKNAVGSDIRVSTSTVYELMKILGMVA